MLMRLGCSSVTFWTKCLDVSAIEAMKVTTHAVQGVMVRLDIKA